MSKHSPHYREFTYLADEGDLSKKAGVIIPAPIRVFSLEGLGFDQQAFLEMFAPTFVLLPWDPYDVKREQVELLKDHFPDEKDRLTVFLAEYYAGEGDLESVYDLIAKLPAEGRQDLERIRPRRKRSIARFNSIS